MLITKKKESDKFVIIKELTGQPVMTVVVKRTNRAWTELAIELDDGYKIVNIINKEEEDA